MDRRKGFCVIFIAVSYVMTIGQGQTCDEPDLDITDITERNVTLALPPQAATLRITPYPCNETSNVHYGCHCDEDDRFKEIQDVQNSEFTVNFLFPGRYYIFEILNNGETVIACAGTNTVPRQPSVFQFYDQLSPNPKTDAIGVEVQVPIMPDGSDCNPEQHTEISNRFVWSAENNTQGFQDNITSDINHAGSFNFWIDAFYPGREYSLSIQTTSGDQSSKPYKYGDNEGTFRTAIHNVMSLRKIGDTVCYLDWKHATRPRDGYLITYNTTNPSREGYLIGDPDYPNVDLMEPPSLFPGYKFNVTVENHVEGYRQQNIPDMVTCTLEPPAPSNVDVTDISINGALISWAAPDDDFTDEYSYNISVTGIPCSKNMYEFCVCDEYGNDIHTAEGTQFEIPNLYSGRQYMINIRTVTTGPISSDPLDEPIVVYTVPRPPLDISINSTGSTNVTIPVAIQRGGECNVSGEVQGYEIYTLQNGNVVFNDTYVDGSNDEVVTYDIMGLVPGETYIVCVITLAPNQLKSDDVCISDIKTKINAPLIYSLDYDNATISVTWNTVEGEIDGYKLRCESEEGGDVEVDINKDDSEGECKNVTPGALYNVIVDSIKEGYEQYGNPAQNVKLLRPPPIKPTFDVLVQTTTHIRVSWTLNGHLDHIKYEINNGTEEQVPVTEGHFDITEDLEPNGFYNIRLWGVAGMNGEDDFETATQDELVMFQMYSADVQDLKIDNKNASTIDITWSNPPDNAINTSLNHYIVQLWYLGECARTIVMNNTEQSQIDKIDDLCGSLDYETFTGSSVMLSLYDVEPCTNYTVMVIPVNTVGNGMESSELTETEFIGPMEPVDISVVSITATEISLKWNRPEPKNCPMSSHVTVSYVVCEDGELSETETDDVYEIKLDDLQPFTNHTFTVNVFNKGGLMNDSTIVQTLSSAPGQPQEFSVTGITHNSAIFNWKPVNECEENGIIVDYLLSVCPGDLQETCKTRVIEDGTSFTLTELDPYTQHTYTLQARNGHDGDPIPGSFSTEMYNPEQPGIESVANCDGITITIVAPDKINGPLDGYRIEMWKQGNDQDRNTWSCNMDNCNKYGDPTTQLTISEDDFDDTVDLSQDDVYIAECIIKNTQFDSEPVQSSISVDGCNGSDPDVGLIVGLTFMGIAIIIIVLGLIYARKKKLGPFRESDDGFSYLEGESMEAVSVGNGNTSNNHAVAGTANAAFSKEDDIEVVESSRPIQIDQFEAYCNDSYEDSQYKMAEQFGVIKKQSPVYEGIECRRPENKPKNRYTNILPFDWSLVKLKTRVGVPFSEYINATYIPGEWGKDEYIATQGPVTETVDDFWRMVWEQDTPIVIMLTVFVQNNKAKCVMYWPEAGSTMVCGDILVTTKSSDSWGFDDQYRTREIHLKCNDQVRVITQYQMVEWPDYGCPDSPDELLDLVETVRQQCPDDRMTRLVVHCSAGVGRTGTYIAVDRLRQQLDNKEPTDTIDIQAMISEMREYRPHMVQTEAQYTYIHDCVNAMLLRKHGQNVDNGEVDIYENTDYPRKVSAESTNSDNPTMSGAMPYPIKVSADSTDSDKPTMSGTMSMSVIV